MINLFKLLFFIIALISQPIFAIKLPVGLTKTELKTLIETLAFGNVTRVMRSAEAYPIFPGVKISFETTLVHSGNLNDLGNGSASFPIVIPSPRLNITKGLGMGLETAINLSSQEVLQTMATLGFLGKWTYLEERDSFATSAVFINYTRLNGFNDSFSGDEFEIGVMASKDFVRLKPYIGLGLLFATATVSKTVSPLEQSGSSLAPHLLIGTEIELPMNIAFQIDFTQQVPSGSFSLGYRF